MKELNYERVFNTLVEETRNYITRNNLSAMVLGISGGIDSTVVAAICREVSNQTGIPLIGRSLPIRNKGDEFSVSELVGKAFCDDFKVIALEIPYTIILNLITFDEYGYDPVKLMKEDEDIYQNIEKHIPEQTPIANGNIQARLRMMHLYNLASTHKGLVMSTDNQTEYQLGFWTLHGDVGDFDPIQGLWKTEVYELAKWIVTHYQNIAVTPNRECWENRAWRAIVESIKLTPTDGLGISNSDLDQIGAKSYDEVDDILQTLIPICEWRPELGTIQIQLDKLYDKYGQEVVDKVWDRHKASQFKRKCLPISIDRSKYEQLW